MEINKLISTIIVAIVMGIVVFLFVMPKYRELSLLQSVLAQRQAEYDSESAYNEKIAEMIRGMDSKKDAVDKINSALPADVNFSPLVYFFQKETAEAGLNLKSITFTKVSSPAVGQSVKNISFNLLLSGGYQSLKDLLLTLDLSARLFEVNSISFRSAPKPAAATSETPIYDFQLEVVTHTY